MSLTLNNNQKKFIKNIIKHLLVFSVDPDQLKQQLHDLKTALAAQSDSNNDYHWLGQCLHYPTLNFLGLERQTASNDQEEELSDDEELDDEVQKELNAQGNLPATVEDVQAYVIKLIARAYNSAAKQAELDLISSLELVKVADLKEGETRFISVARAISGGENPLLEMLVLEGAIYTRELKVKEDPLRRVVVDVEVFLPNKTKKITLHLDEVPYFEDDRLEREYYENLKPQAENEALIWAGNQAIDYLLTLDHLKKSKALREIKSKQPALKVLTSEYYFSQINQNKFHPYFLRDIDADRADYLMSRVVIDLIDNGKIALSDARLLTSSENRVVSSPAFHAMLKSGKLDFVRNVKGVSERRSKLLANPFIANSIAQRKLTLKQATKLPAYLVNVSVQLGEPKELAYFHDLNFTKILSSVSFINSFLFQEYIVTENVDWNSLSKITLAQCRLFLLKEFYPIISQRILTLDDVMKLSNEAIELIFKNPHLCDWMMLELVDSDDLRADKFVDANAVAYALRIHKLINNAPYKIGEGDKAKIDTAEIIMAEIPRAARSGGISNAAMQNEILGALMMLVKNEIALNYDKYNDKEKAYLKRILSQVSDDVLDDSANWHNQFNALMRLLQKIQSEVSFTFTRQTYDTEHTLYAAKRPRLSIIQSTIAQCCEKFLKLAIFGEHRWVGVEQRHSHLRAPGR